MTPDAWLVIAVAVVAVVLFVTEWVAPALVALAVMATLMATEILSFDQAVQGLSDEATVTVAAMFILGAGLQKSGAVDGLGTALAVHLRRRRWVGWFVILGGTAVASAFVNNTAVVAVLIPILIRSARDADMSPSRLLMPASFASMLGGMCTLMGTSTNLVVSTIVVDGGGEPLGFFEMLPFGGILLVLGLVYLSLARRFIPERRADRELTRCFDMGPFLTRVTIAAGSPSVGQHLSRSPLTTHLDLKVLSIVRDDASLAPSEDPRLAPGDVLQVLGPRRAIEEMSLREGLVTGLEPVADLDLENDDLVLTEVVVSSISSIAGKSIEEVDLWERFDAKPLAIRRPEGLRRGNLARRVINAGDVLLLLIPRARRPALEAARDFIVISGEPLRSSHPHRLYRAVAIALAVVALAAAGVFPISIAASMGAIAMVLAGGLDLRDAYGAIEWDVVFLLAGMLALGTAFSATGVDQDLAALLTSVHGYGAEAMVASLFALTLVLTSTMSNQATAALLTPIAISLAASLGVSSRPLIMAVAFGASSSFLTPVGYQTNTMVYGAGHYRFGDFVRVGGPLSLLATVLAAWLIPQIWPL